MSRPDYRVPCPWCGADVERPCVVPARVAGLGVQVLAFPHVERTAAALRLER